MLCPAMVKKIVKRNEPVYDSQTKRYTGEKILKKEEKVTICGKKQERFFRVHYAELHRYLEGEGKYFDMFGLCAEHALKLEHNPKAWNKTLEKYHKAVSGLRGRVERIEVVLTETNSLEDARAAMKEDKNQRIIAAVKQDLKKKMNQSNTRKLTVEHWRQCFDETLDEWVTESVMEG